MTIETLRGRYRLHRFPPRQRAVTGEPLTTSISAADYQRQLMDGFQEGLQKGFAQGMTEGQEQGFSEGHQQGFAEGRRQGYTEGSLAGQQEGRKQFVEAAQPLEAITGKVNDFLAHIERKQREDLLQLVEKVTRQVIRCELALQPTQLLALVEEALAAFPAMPETLQVMLSTEEFNRLRDAVPEKVSEWGLTPSPDLPPGECRVITDKSELDIGCEHRLEQCMTALKETLTPESFSAFDNALRSLESIPLARVAGRLVRLNGILLESVGCPLMTGQLCRIESANHTLIDAQAVGFNRDITYLMPFKQPVGLMAGARVFPEEKAHDILIGESCLGRVVNGLGEPLDGKGRLNGNDLLPPLPPSVNPLTRRSVDEPLDVGVKAINGLLTIGKGQRVGLMAGSGVGKSVLLGMITRQTKADIVVVGLIGERGREVKEFIDHSLGADGLAKSIVVVAPADESPLMRLKATELCHSIAAWFRDRGHHVLLLVDSLTRYAMAQREIALSLGEPPATKGYPPSAFGMIPKLVESAGNSESAGSMTAIYTVLAEGDDQQDPIVDCARAVLDGHIVLTRKLAEAGHYPAIDIGQSISRCMNQVTSLEHQQSARALKQNYAAYMEIKPLIPLGGYVAGADASVDKAVKMFPAIERFLRQEMREPASLELVQSRLQILFPGVKKAEQ